MVSILAHRERNGGAMRRSRAAVTVGLLASCALTVSSCSSTASGGGHEATAPASSSAPILGPANVAEPASATKVLLQVHDGVGAQAYSVPSTGAADIRVGYTCFAPNAGHVSVSAVQAHTGTVLFTQNESCLNSVQGFEFHLDGKDGAAGFSVKITPPANAQYSLAAFETS